MKFNKIVMGLVLILILFVVVGCSSETNTNIVDSKVNSVVDKPAEETKTQEVEAPQVAEPELKDNSELLSKIRTGLQDNENFCKENFPTYSGGDGEYFVSGGTGYKDECKKIRTMMVLVKNFPADESEDQLCEQWVSDYKIPSVKKEYCNTFRSKTEDGWTDEIMNLYDCATKEYEAFNSWAQKYNKAAQDGKYVGELDFDKFSYTPTNDCVFN